MKRIIRMSAVEDKTGLKHSEIYERIKDLTFPRQLRMGPKRVGWLEEEIDAWIDELAAEREAEAALTNAALEGKDAADV